MIPQLPTEIWEMILWQARVTTYREINALYIDPELQDPFLHYVVQISFEEFLDWYWAVHDLLRIADQ